MVVEKTWERKGRRPVVQQRAQPRFEQQQELDEETGQSMIVENEARRRGLIVYFVQ